MTTNNKIIINSPAGCGNVFAQWLIKSNMDADIIWKFHDLNGFENGIPNIFILRNPFDAIASAVEITHNNLNARESEYFDEHVSNRIDYKILAMSAHYEMFLNRLEVLPYVKIVSFEHLTKDPENFLNMLSKDFKLNFKRQNHRVSAEMIKIKMAADTTMLNRSPREKTDLRKKIDIQVNANKHLEEIYQKYLFIKNNILVN